VDQKIKKAGLSEEMPHKKSHFDTHTVTLFVKRCRFKSDVSFNLIANSAGCQNLDNLTLLLNGAGCLVSGERKTLWKGSTGILSPGINIYLEICSNLILSFEFH
jgi:hypothetical protein